MKFKQNLKVSVTALALLIMMLATMSTSTAIAKATPAAPQKVKFKQALPLLVPLQAANVVVAVNKEDATTIASPNSPYVYASPIDIGRQSDINTASNTQIQATPQRLTANNISPQQTTTMTMTTQIAPNNYS